MAARASWFAIAVLAIACDKPKPDPDPPQEPDPPDTPDTRPLACGDGGERFVDLAFVPSTVRAAAKIRISDGDLDATLRVLSEAARGDDNDLPIDVAFALGQWSWQVPLVVATMARAGHRPGDLLWMHMSTGVSAWAWPSSCNLEVQTDVARRGWSLAVEPSAHGAVARGGDGFAYDVLYYREAFVAFAPAGKASALAQSLAALPSGDAVSPGDVLGTADAPIHLVLRGRALVTPEADPDGEPLRQLVATRDGLRELP